MGQKIEFVGKLSMPKESEKFKPFEERTFDSGWKKKTLKLNMVCGTNRHMLSLEAGCFADGHNDIYLFSKGGQDANGNKIKGERFTIKFADRLTSPRLEEVAEFKKFVLDIEERGRRAKLKKAIEGIKEGKEITSDELVALNITSVDDLEEEYAKSLKRRKEYVSEWDFIDTLKKVVESGKYDKKKFKVTGEQTTEYSEFSDKFYTKFVPQKIYLVPDDELECSSGVVEMYFTGEAIDETMVEDKGKYYINGFGLEYNGQLKRNVGYPITLAMTKKDDEKADKRLKTYKKFFTTEDGAYKKIAVEVEFLDGSPKIAITDDLLMEMLTEEQSDLLMLEEVTLDDLRKEMGLENTYGDRITETQFIKVARGYTKGAEDTVYTDETFAKPVKEVVEENSDDELDINDLDLDDL